jgi:hypothetical protein
MHSAALLRNWSKLGKSAIISIHMGTDRAHRQRPVILLVNVVSMHPNVRNALGLWMAVRTRVKMAQRKKLAWPLLYLETRCDAKRCCSAQSVSTIRVRTARGNSLQPLLAVELLVANDTPDCQRHVAMQASAGVDQVWTAPSWQGFQCSIGRCGHVFGLVSAAYVTVGHTAA